VKHSEEIDFEQWGGLRSETSDKSTILVSEGVHIKRWRESVIIYRITNASLLRESETLLVGFNAAISKRDEKVAPFFTGGGKATNLKSPILSISDSSTHHGDVALGWYLGTLEDPNYQENLAEFIQQLCLENKVKPILFGGSGGGFASIAVGDLLNIESIVFAMNPQTNVLDWFEGPLKKLYKNQWNVSTKEDFNLVLEQQNIRYSFDKLQQNPKSKVLILQNLFDDLQMVKHMKAVFGDLSIQNLTPTGTKSNLTWFIGCWGPGHFSPWPYQIKECLRRITSTQEIQGAVEYLMSEFYPDMTGSKPTVNLQDISLSGGGTFGDFNSILSYRARSDLERLKIPIYGFDFSSFDTSDRNLAFCISSLRQCDFLFRDHKNNPFIRHIVLHHLLAWWKFSRTSEGVESVMAWYDMSSGLRAQKVAYLLCISKYIPGINHYRETLEEIALEHIKWFSKPGFVKLGNHGIFQIHGLMAIAISLGLNDQKTKASKLMDSIFQTQFSAELMHVENSPEYHQYVITIFDAYFRTGWYGRDIKTKLSNAKTLNYWLIDSNNRNLCIGDSEPKKITLSNEQIMNAVNGADFSFENDNQIYHVKEFKTTGYLCVKALSPGTNLFFSLSAFTNIGHRQADDLSFILYDSGFWRFEDPGKYTYQRDKRKYIDRTHQHNSLAVDNQSYSVRSEGQYPSCRRITRFIPEHGVFHTSMSWQPLDGVEHSRDLFYMPNNFFAVVDRLESENIHKYGQWFQIGNDFSDYTQTAKSLIFESPENDFFEIEFISSPDESKIQVFRGNHDLPVGWISKKYQEIQPNLAIEHYQETNQCDLWMIARFSKHLETSEIKKMISTIIPSLE
jgi:predicted esterase YcpF (UPF0227 family)